MSANPLADDPAREHRIRVRAYHLWIDLGRPHGQDTELWERARELVGMEDAGDAGQLANPQAAGQDPSAEQPVEEAFLQDNLGEFPGRFADQGEVQQTPHASHGATATAAGSLADAAPKAEAKPAAPRPESLPAKPSLKAKALKESKPAAKPSAPGKKSKPKR